MWQVLTRGDKALVLVVGLLAAGLSLHQGLRAEAGGRIAVEVDGVRRGEYPLEGEGRLRFEGPLGVAELEIGARGARALSAPCANQLCVRQGWVRRRGEAIVCVPNRLIARVEGAAGPDAVVR